MPYTYSQSVSVADASAVDRASFIRRTYSHVAGATLALIALEAALLNSPLAPAFANAIGQSRWSWLIVLGVFMMVSFIANRWAFSQTSKEVQYAGLGIYVLAESIILIPLLYIAQRAFGNGLILQAGMVTVGLFLGLTAIVYMTRKDFSFLRGFLTVGCFVALGLIVAGIAFGFTLGLWFTVAMIMLVAGCILYNTSNIMLHYHTTQHVGAALALFSSIATLFWYVLQFLMSITSND